MNLDDGTLQRAYAVLKGHAGVGVCAGIEHYAVVAEAHLLHLVYHLSLYVALEIGYLHVGETLLQLGQIGVEGVAAVDARLTNSEQVEVWTI